MNVQGKMIRVQGKDCLGLACHIASVYHNQIAYNAQSDDGFCEEMDGREKAIQARMEEDSSDEGIMER